MLVSFLWATFSISFFSSCVEGKNQSHSFVDKVKRWLLAVDLWYPAVFLTPVTTESSSLSFLFLSVVLRSRERNTCLLIYSLTEQWFLHFPLTSPTDCYRWLSFYGHSCFCKPVWLEHKAVTMVSHEKVWKIWSIREFGMLGFYSQTQNMPFRTILFC